MRETKLGFCIISDLSMDVDKKSGEPDLKRQKLEEKLEDKYSSGSDSECSFDSDDVRMFEDEHKRSGDYDFDTTKQGRLVGRRAVVFENSDIADEPETDGELVERLSKIALEKYNEDEHTSLEVVRAVKANWHHGGGYSIYITFEAKDHSHCDPITFQAAVGYLPRKVRVYRINPKP